MGAPFVTVIIVNYNSGERLEKCLACLKRQTFQDFDIVIVDNASTDESLNGVDQGKSNIQLLRAGTNLGFAAANNLAAIQAKGEWLALLNPDAYARPDWLERFAAATGQYPGVDAFGSTQLDANNPNILDGAGDVVHAFGLYYRGGFGAPAGAAPEDGVTASPCAAAAFYRRSTFERLGGFDERFFCYGEDVDLGFRLWLSGGIAMQLRDVIVEHEGSGVTGRRSDFSIYHGVRNRLWLYHKNLPAIFRYGLAPVHIVINLLMLLRSVAAGEGAAYWRGLRDGLAGLPLMVRHQNTTLRTRSFTELAHYLTWSPVKLLRRSPDVRTAIEKNGP